MRAVEPTVEQRVTANLPLARFIAARYARRGGESFDDLYQVACLGLVLAAQRFDPGRGFTFSTYANSVISGEIKRHFRDHCWPVHVPRTMSEKPDRTELEQQWVVGAGWPASLDATVAERSDGEAVTLADTLGEDDTAYALVDARVDRQLAWQRCTALERRVLVMHIYEDVPQREIAARINYSQMHVSRLLRRAYKKLGLPAEASKRRRAIAA